MIFLALILLYVILFLMDGRSARRNKRNRVKKAGREHGHKGTAYAGPVRIRATVPDYPGRHGLHVRVR